MSEEEFDLKKEGSIILSKNTHTFRVRERLRTDILAFARRVYLKGKQDQAELDMMIRKKVSVLTKEVK